MKGILKLAYKLLVNDKAKFTALLVGITFAVYLMMFVTSMFFGVLNHASANIINIGTTIWVMDPAVETVSNSVGMPDYVLDAVRSMQGVKYAVPLYSGGALVKLSDGTYQSVNVVGLDDTSLLGRPALLEGKIEDIYAENGFIAVRDAEFPKLENPHVGSEFELNDNRAVIVGIAEVATSGLYGTPTLYTTYERAIQYIPNPRYTISYVLVEPKSANDIPADQTASRAVGLPRADERRVHAENRRLLRIPDWRRNQHADHDCDQLRCGPVNLRSNLLHVHSRKPGTVWSIEGHWYKKPRLDRHDPVPGHIHGLHWVRSWGWVMCTFDLAGKVKAAASYAAMLTYASLAIGFVMVAIIAAVSSYAGIRKVLQIDPFSIFRG